LYRSNQESFLSGFQLLVSNLLAGSKCQNVSDFMVLSYSIVSSDVSEILAWSISVIGLKFYHSAAEKCLKHDRFAKAYVSKTILGEQWWLIGEQWWLIGEQWWLTGEQWWLMGEQWWLMGSSGGSSGSSGGSWGAVVAHW
jgi:hypothetical protein